MSKLLTFIKDEYARDWGFDNWHIFQFVNENNHLKMLHAVDEIATRYAAKQAKAFSEWLDKNQFHMNKWGDWDNGKTLMTTETAYRIFEKETAHYDNQNTDV